MSELSAEEKRIQLLRDYKNVFNSDAGRRVLDDLKKATTLGCRAIPAGISIDTNWLIYDEAQRVFVLDILAKLEVDLDIQIQTVALTEGDSTDGT